MGNNRSSLNIYLKHNVVRYIEYIIYKELWVELVNMSTERWEGFLREIKIYKILIGKRNSLYNIFCPEYCWAISKNRFTRLKHKTASKYPAKCTLGKNPTGSHAQFISSNHYCFLKTN